MVAQYCMANACDQIETVGTLFWIFKWEMFCFDTLLMFGLKEKDWLQFCLTNERWNQRQTLGAFIGVENLSHLKDQVEKNFVLTMMSM